MGSSIVRIDRLMIDILGNIPSTAERNPHREQAFIDKEFVYVGLVAIVDVSYPINAEGKRRKERFASDTTWAIEGDSAASVFRGIARKELLALEGHLQKFFIETAAAFDVSSARLAEITEFVEGNIQLFRRE